MLTIVDYDDDSNETGQAVGAGRSLLDEIVRDGARQMLAAALQAEVADYIARHAGEIDDNGHRLVVRNGYHAEREVVTAAGAVAVKAPRVNDKRVDPDTGERRRFSSTILPAWARKSAQVSEVLPLLYLHGLSTSDFGPALEQFLGTGAGLSASSITRLTTQWQDEARAFAARDLSEADYVYLWVDGIHLKVRLEQEKLCLLVMIGVRADGRKELVALSDGYRESTESWADLLRDCRRRPCGRQDQLDHHPRRAPTLLSRRNPRPPRPLTPSRRRRSLTGNPHPRRYAEQRDRPAGHPIDESEQKAGGGSDTARLQRMVSVSTSASTSCAIASRVPPCLPDLSSPASVWAVRPSITAREARGEARTIATAASGEAASGARPFALRPC